jgi:hypothetical protein
MRPFLISAVAAVFAGSLAFILPSGPASAGVTSATANCPEGTAQKMDDGWGCTIPLKVRPPGHGGGSNPNDWGMCGILSLTGSFGPVTRARIIVDSSGYYAVQLIGSAPGTAPSMDWTCVLFTDFKGVPPAADATSSGPPFPSFNGGSGGGSIPIAGSAKNACIWAGLSGNLETLKDGGDVGAFGDASAQYFGPETILGSMNVTSYAICSGYSSPGWVGWRYLHRGGGYYAPDHIISLGLNDTRDWCYMDFVEAYLIYPIYSLGPISAGLILSGGGNYSIFGDPAGGAFVNFNCLPLTQ